MRKDFLGDATVKATTALVNFPAKFLMGAMIMIYVVMTSQDFICRYKSCTLCLIAYLNLELDYDDGEERRLMTPDDIALACEY